MNILQVCLDIASCSYRGGNEQAGGNNEISEGISKALFQRWCPGALAPGGFKAAGGRAQARQAASPALPRTSSQG